MNNSAPSIHKTNIMEDVQQLLWWEEKLFATVEPPDPVLPPGLVLRFTVWPTVCLRRGTIARIVSVWDRAIAIGGKRLKREKRSAYQAETNGRVVFSASHKIIRRMSPALSPLCFALLTSMYFSLRLSHVPLECYCWHPPPCFLSLIPLPWLPQPLSLHTLTCSGAFSPFSTLHSSWNPLLTGQTLCVSSFHLPEVSVTPSI